MNNKKLIEALSAVIDVAFSIPAPCTQVPEIVSRIQQIQSLLVRQDNGVHSREGFEAWYSLRFSTPAANIERSRLNPKLDSNGVMVDSKYYRDPYLNRAYLTYIKYS